MDAATQWKTAASQSRSAQWLSGKITLTWHTGGADHKAQGVVMLGKPNRARLTLTGDFPQPLLVSDGVTRTVFRNATEYDSAPSPATGDAIDSPWWALPLRFFFTQNADPFGRKDARPEIVLTKKAGRVLALHGSSPMGNYSERLTFSASGDLVASEVRFGEGPGAAVFSATLTDVHHSPIPSAAFRFTPKTGQVLTSLTDRLLAVGQKAPPFTLRDPSGNVVRLADIEREHKLVLVNFWYYNCAPCRLEFPEFEQLFEDFKNQGFTIVAIDKGDTPAVVGSYASRTRLTFPLLMGGEVTATSVFQAYQVGESFPVSYLLNGEGRVIWRGTGADVAAIRRVLSEQGIR